MGRTGQSDIVLFGAGGHAKVVIETCAGTSFSPAKGELGIVNTCASVVHECRFGRAVHVALNATLRGNVFAGDRVSIGAGSAVIEGTRIADTSSLLPALQWSAQSNARDRASQAFPQGC